ncbi:MAG: outer membrane protein [Acidobacteriota bacterium]|jgi:outer membrane protein TolC|nr:outer membrane protein [Acidobacteriota bacterium]
MTAVSRLMLIVCVTGATTLAAQTTQPTTPTTASSSPQLQRQTAPVQADTDRDVNDPRALKLSLDDAIRASIRQNLGVELERYSFRETVQDLRGSYGIFDIFTTAQLNRSNKESTALSAFDASSSGATNANADARQLLPTGGTYSIGIENQRFTRSGFGTTLSPGYSAGLTLGLTQPLARNFGVDVTRRGINIARNNLGINREQFRTALLDTTNAVEQAYLDLIYTRQYIDVVRESVFLARDQSRITQIRIDVGASAPLDILQPRVQIATTEESLIRAVADVRSAEDRLRALMNLPDSEWDRPIIPTETIGYAPVTINVEESVTRAYELRPEIRQNVLATDISRIQYLYARNQVLPQFDVVGGYNLSGAAGRPIDSSSGLPDRGFGSAVEQVFRNDFPGWNIGLNIGVPVFNIGARADAKRSELEVQRVKLLGALTKQNIAVGVRSTARAIDTASKEISASHTAREAAEQNLDAERKRYENGMTTNFQVLQVQQQLSDARARELQALVSYNQALAAYHRAVGDLLDVHHIATEEPEKVDEPSFFTRFDKYKSLTYAAHDKEATPEDKKQ